MMSGNRSVSVSTLTVILAGLAIGLLAVTSVSNAEIHRAKAISSKPYHHGRTAALKNRLLQAQRLQAGFSWNVTGWLESLQEWAKSVTDGDRSHVWIYSLLSAGLVGLSGIFPLLVIPLEVGEALKKGGSANNRLKLLLSFAVGGLLGDVFLHLLPEAWAHVDKLGGAHDGNINIGCWVLAGLLLFMIIEKLFPESSDEEEEDVSEDNDQHLSSEHYKQNHEDVKDNTHTCVKNGYQNGNLQNNGIVNNGHVKNGYANGVCKNGVKNGYANGVCQNGVKNGYANGYANGVCKNGTISHTVVADVYENGVQNGTVLKGLNGTIHSKTGYQNGLLKQGFNQNDPVTTAGSLQSSSNSVLKRRKPCDELLNDNVADCKNQPVQSSHKATIKTSGWLNLMANIVDNFTHGLAVAGSYSVGVKTGLITTVAILLHEVPHEIGDFAILLRSGFDRWRAAKAQLLTATGGILGAVAALTAESAQSAGDRTAWILPFTAGGFIYIAMVTVLPDLLRENKDIRQSLKQFILVCVGIAIMAAITIFVD